MPHQRCRDADMRLPASAAVLIFRRASAAVLPIAAQCHATQSNREAAMLTFRARRHATQPPFYAAPMPSSKDAVLREPSLRLPDAHARFSRFSPSPSCRHALQITPARCPADSRVPPDNAAPSHHAPDALRRLAFSVSACLTSARRMDEPAFRQTPECRPPLVFTQELF